MSLTPLAPGRARAVRLLLATLLLLIVLPLVGMSLFSLIRMDRIWMGDYLSYAAAAERLLAGAPVYAAFQLEGPYQLGLAAWGEGFVYPPVAVLTAVPFSVVGRESGFALFTLTSAVALAVVAHRIGRSQGLGPRAAAILAVLVMLSAPVLESLGTGQANTFIAAGFGATWVWRRSSGYMAVIGGLLKVFPLAGIAWAFRCRAPILVPLLVGASLVALSVAVLGIDAWRDFAVALTNGTGSATWFPEPPRHALEPVLGPTGASVVAYGLAGVLALASVLVRDDRTAFALLGLAMITPAPDWFVHYFTVPVVGVLPWVASLAVGWPALWARLGTTDEHA